MEKLFDVFFTIWDRRALKNIFLVLQDTTSKLTMSWNFIKSFDNQARGLNEAQQKF